MTSFVSWWSRPNGTTARRSNVMRTVMESVVQEFDLWVKADPLVAVVTVLVIGFCLKTVFRGR